MGEINVIHRIVGVVIGIVILVLVILLPLSYSTLEYYDIGFLKRKSTGSVDTDNVYGPGGRYLIGPDYEYKIFQADGHRVWFKDVSVFTADRLTCILSVHFYYFLRVDQLKLLHKYYDLSYAAILRSNALDALKGAATQFTNREYVSKREEISKVLGDAVRERLSGACCEKGCLKSGLDKCVNNCKPYDSCDESDFGLFVNVKYFVLWGIDLPDEINERNLRTLTLNEENEREQFRQQAQIVRRVTDADVAKIENIAKEVLNEAYQKRDLMLSQAGANASAIRENARSEGLKHIYDGLNITDSAKRASFDYLRTLRKKNNIHMMVNFDQLIAGKLP